MKTWRLLEWQWQLELLHKRLKFEMKLKMDMNTASKLAPPHTHQPRAVPLSGALSLLQKPLRHRGVKQNSCPAFM
jgi:hypothetical protein